MDVKSPTKSNVTAPTKTQDASSFIQPNDSNLDKSLIFQKATALGSDQILAAQKTRNTHDDSQIASNKADNDSHDSSNTAIGAFAPTNPDSKKQTATRPLAQKTSVPSDAINTTPPETVHTDTTHTNSTHDLLTSAENEATLNQSQSAPPKDEATAKQSQSEPPEENHTTNSVDNIKNGTSQKTPSSSTTETHNLVPKPPDIATKTRNKFVLFFEKIYLFLRNLSVTSKPNNLIPSDPKKIDEAIETIKGYLLKSEYSALETLFEPTQNKTAQRNRSVQTLYVIALITFLSKMPLIHKKNISEKLSEIYDLFSKLDLENHVLEAVWYYIIQKKSKIMAQNFMYFLLKKDTTKVPSFFKRCLKKAVEQEYAPVVSSLIQQYPNAKADQKLLKLKVFDTNTPSTSSALTHREEIQKILSLVMSKDNYSPVKKKTILGLLKKLISLLKKLFLIGHSKSLSNSENKTLKEESLISSNIKSDKLKLNRSFLRYSIQQNNQENVTNILEAYPKLQFEHPDIFEESNLLLAARLGRSNILKKMINYSNSNFFDPLLNRDPLSYTLKHFDRKNPGHQEILTYFFQKNSHYPLEDAHELMDSLIDTTIIEFNIEGFQAILDLPEFSRYGKSIDKIASLLKSPEAQDLTQDQKDILEHMIILLVIKIKISCVNPTRELSKEEQEHIKKAKESIQDFKQKNIDLIVHDETYKELKPDDPNFSTAILSLSEKFQEPLQEYHLWSNIQNKRLSLLKTSLESKKINLDTNTQDNKTVLLKILEIYDEKTDENLKTVHPMDSEILKISEILKSAEVPSPQNIDDAIEQAIAAKTTKPMYIILHAFHDTEKFLEKLTENKKFKKLISSIDKLSIQEIIFVKHIIQLLVFYGADTAMMISKFHRLTNVNILQEKNTNKDLLPYLDEIKKFLNRMNLLQGKSARNKENIEKSIQSLIVRLKRVQYHLTEKNTVQALDLINGTPDDDKGNDNTIVQTLDVKDLHRSVLIGAAGSFDPEVLDALLSKFIYNPEELNAALEAAISKYKEGQKESAVLHSLLEKSYAVQQDTPNDPVYTAITHAKLDAVKCILSWIHQKNFIDHSSARTSMASLEKYISKVNTKIAEANKKQMDQEQSVVTPPTDAHQSTALKPLSADQANGSSKDSTDSVSVEPSDASNPMQNKVYQESLQGFLDIYKIQENTLSEEGKDTPTEETEIQELIKIEDWLQNTQKQFLNRYNSSSQKNKTDTKSTATS